MVKAVGRRKGLEKFCESKQHVVGENREKRQK